MGTQVKFIAEIGWNFVGDLDLAEEMIKSASAAGADFAKFQVWNPDHLKAGPWDSDGRREIYNKAYLDKDKIIHIKNICQMNNINFLASVFEQKSLRLLNSISSDAVKIPSHECNNFSLIDAAKSSFDHVFLSVGSVTSSDLSKILSKYSNDKDITLMHCVSAYPLEAQNINLPKFLRLKSYSPNIGFSSHYTSIYDAIVATSLGACLIEKHFTTSHDLPGRDNKFALLPSDFMAMIHACREVESMMIDCGDDVQTVEVDVVSIMRGRWNG